MIDKLKPCPFCGARQLKGTTVIKHKKHCFFYVLDGANHGTYGEHFLSCEILKSWNRRADGKGE
jgi:hypothetical protein